MDPYTALVVTSLSDRRHHLAFSALPSAPTVPDSTSVRERTASGLVRAARRLAPGTVVAVRPAA